MIPVVERSAEGSAFFLADADDGASDVVPANFLADGIDAWEQVVHEIGANDADGRGGVEIGIGDVTAFDEVDIVEFRHQGSPGTQIGVLQRVQAAAGFDAAADGGADLLAGFAELADGVVIVESDALAFLKFKKVIYVGDDRRLLGEGEDISAKVEDFGGNVLVGAVDEADDGNDRSNPDDHSDERQDAAEFVSPQTGGGNANGFREMQPGGARHGFLTLSYAVEGPGISG